MLNIGVLGAGHIAKSFHLPAWKKVKNASVKAICDIDDLAVKNVANAFGINAYLSFEEMLKNEKIDIVDICTPNALHIPQASLALESKKHVIVEKPLATCSKDIDHIISLSKKYNKKVMCAQHQRFRPPSKAAKQLVLNGELGKIYFTRAQAIKCREVPAYSNSYTSIDLSGGGPLMDLGAHIIDLAWWLMGCPKPKSVFGTVANKLANSCSQSNLSGTWDRYDVEDFACAKIKFVNGAVLSLETSYLANSNRDVLEVELFGDQGGLFWPSLILSQDQNGIFQRKKIKFNDKILASVAELQHFTDCVIHDNDTQIPLSESREVIRIIEGIYESSKTSSLFEF
jgi:predicted dehydrogenase